VRFVNIRKYITGTWQPQSTVIAQQFVLSGNLCSMLM